jgi:translation elongation factor EF-G
MPIVVPHNVLAVLRKKWVGRYAASYHRGSPVCLLLMLQAFGPGTRGPNILLDATHNNSGALNEIKESIVASFSWVTKEGVLCEESMRGIGMKIVDVSLHPDSFHRGGWHTF